MIVLSVVAASLGLLWPILRGSAEGRGFWAAAFGGGLAAANTVAAHVLTLWGTGRSNTAFMGAVLGGMVGRMGLMLAAVVAGILWLGLPKVQLAVSLLAYFVVFLVVELAILHRQTTRPAEVG